MSRMGSGTMWKPSKPYINLFSYGLRLSVVDMAISWWFNCDFTVIPQRWLWLQPLNCWEISFIPTRHASPCLLWWLVQRPKSWEIKIWISQDKPKISHGQALVAGWWEMKFLHDWKITAISSTTKLRKRVETWRLHKITTIRWRSSTWRFPEIGVPLNHPF